MDPRVIHHETHNDLVDASHIVVRRGCFPVRIVLRKLNGKFATHMEILEGAPEVVDETQTGLKFKHRGYEQGHYFDFKTPDDIMVPVSMPTEKSALRQALEDFKQRIKSI